MKWDPANCDTSNYTEEIIKFADVELLSTVSICSVTSTIWLCTLIRSLMYTKLKFIYLLSTLMLLSQIAEMYMKVSECSLYY